jgi:hypothetical protein
MTNYEPKYMRMLAICLIIAIILVTILTSCYSERTARNQFSKAAVAYPKILAQSCAVTYPVKDSTIRDTLLTTDTIYIEGQDLTDTVRSLDTIIITHTIQLPGKVITNTVHIRDTIIKENTAALKVCQLDNGLIMDLLKKQTYKADKYKAQSGKRGLYMWSLLALIIVYCGWKVYGIFKPKKINI